jgi:antitoxin YefM
MDSITYTSLRQNLASALDQVNNNHRPILIKRQNGKDAVLISFEDFKSYEETAYLLSSPENAKQLAKALSEVKAGKVVRKDLIE